MVDYHVHCRLSRHGEGDLFEFVETAIEKGLQEIGFAEHIPIPDLDDPTGRMPIEDWAVYVGNLFSAKEQYPEITIRFGIEADYLPAYQSFIENFVRAFPFDFVLGSVHFISDWDFSNMDFQRRLEEFGAEHLYRRYYRLVAEAASCGLYDVIGHFDLPKRLCPAMPPEVAELRDEALNAVRRSGLALDVNTSGLRKANDIYPAPEILSQACELGIPVTIGSDAHKPSEVAADLGATIERLKKIGYRHCLGFEGRRAYRIPL